MKKAALIAFVVFGSALLALTLGTEHPLLAALLVAIVVTAVAVAERSRVIRAFEGTLAQLRLISRGETTASEIRAPLGERSRDVVREVARTIETQRAAVRSQQRILHQILDGFGEGLLAIDAEKRVVLSNRGFREMFNLEEVNEGRFYYELIRASEVLASFDKALSGRASVARAVIPVEEEERVIELRVVPLEDSDSISAVGLFIDVTRIERLARIRSEFISDFSHEVRTPLAALQSAVETLESGFGSEEQRQQLLKIVSRQIERLERLSWDLADLNRIESGEIALNLERTDVGALIDNVIADFADRAAKAGVWLIAQGDAVTAEIDPVRIEQVLTNLIDNALKHAPESDQIVVSTIAKEDRFELAVADQGPGVSEAERDRIFNRFYRVDRSRSTSLGGAGLGLAIVKHIVRRQGGRIRVDSDGKGATFVVTLPYDQPATDPAS